MNPLSSHKSANPNVYSDVRVITPPLQCCSPVSTYSVSLDSYLSCEKSESIGTGEKSKPDIDTNTITLGVFADLMEIKRKYSIFTPHISNIFYYLIHHPDIIGVLWNAIHETSLKFGNRGEISLEVRTGDDPSDQILTLFVRMENYPDDIIDQSDTVCEKFESDLIGIEGFLLVTTDFQQPKYKK